MEAKKYDDMFRLLLNDCSSLIIPVINEVFGERYTGKGQMIFSSNEHFRNQKDGNEEERISDTNFKIVEKETKKYHRTFAPHEQYELLRKRPEILQKYRTGIEKQVNPLWKNISDALSLASFHKVR